MPSFGTDIRGSFGKHPLEGRFVAYPSGDWNGFAGDVIASFEIKDYYDFDPELGITPPGGSHNFDQFHLGSMGQVPHRWLTELRDQGMAGEFETKASWKEGMRIHSSLKDIFKFYTYTGDELLPPGHFTLLWSQ